MKPTSAAISPACVAEEMANEQLALARANISWTLYLDT